MSYAGTLTSHSTLELSFLLVSRILALTRTTLHHLILTGYVRYYRIVEVSDASLTVRPLR